MIRIEGGEDLEKKNQTEGNMRGECFSVTRDPASLPRKTVSYTHHVRSFQKTTHMSVEELNTNTHEMHKHTNKHPSWSDRFL